MAKLSCDAEFSSGRVLSPHKNKRHASVISVPPELKFNEVVIENNLLL